MVANRSRKRHFFFLWVTLLALLLAGPTLSGGLDGQVAAATGPAAPSTATVAAPTSIPTAPQTAPQTPTPRLPAPDGFSLVREVPGVSLFRKDYAEGNPDFVQRVDLGHGAGIELLHGPITDPGTDRGVYGGNDPRFKSLPLETYWADFSAAHPDAFCVTNGLFFYMPEEPTRIAFPLKVDGVVISDGWAIHQYPGEKLMLELWDGRANITELSQSSLYNSTAPDIVAGLSEDANKRAKFYVGRTFAGVDDRDGDRWYETVLIFNTLTARQVDAAAVLRSFGADKVMMLDGGGSAQLICADQAYVASERLIPQAIGVTAGPQPTPTPSLKKLERVQSLPKVGAAGLFSEGGGRVLEPQGLTRPADGRRLAVRIALSGVLIVLLAAPLLAWLVYRMVGWIRGPESKARR